MYNTKNTYFSNNKLALVYYVTNNYIVGDIKNVIMQYYFYSIDIIETFRIDLMVTGKIGEISFETEIMDVPNGININNWDFKLILNNNISSYYLKKFYLCVHNHAVKLVSKNDEYFKDIDSVDNYLMVGIRGASYVRTKINSGHYTGTKINFGHDCCYFSYQNYNKNCRKLKKVRKVKFIMNMTLNAGAYHKSEINNTIYAKEITIIG